MGDRASISFRNGDWESVALFSHWRGSGLVVSARKYLGELKADLQRPGGDIYKGMPLGRLDPPTVMIDFVRWLTKDMARVDGDLYLGKDSDDGDNSNQGHTIVTINTNGI